MCQEALSQINTHHSCPPLEKLLAAPRKEAGGYGAHGPPIHEAHPHLLELRHIKPVAGDGLLTIGIILGDRLFDEAQRLARFAPAIEGRPGQPTEPGLVQETYHPLGATFGQADQSVAPPFFLAYSGSGEVIHYFLARSQRTPIRASVARTVSAVMRSSVKPSSKLTSAARSSVHRLVSFRYSLGLRCKSSRKASARSGSKAL